MAFLFPKACESTSLHIASANAGLVHNLVESVYIAFSFGMTYFAPFRIDLRIKILPTLP